jgi:hypothetical protein
MHSNKDRVNIQFRTDEPLYSVLLRLRTRLQLLPRTYYQLRFSCAQYSSLLSSDSVSQLQCQKFPPHRQDTFTTCVRRAH